jgi:hypothetical protein
VSSITPGIKVAACPSSYAYLIFVVVSWNGDLAGGESRAGDRARAIAGAGARAWSWAGAWSWARAGASAGTSAGTRARARA